MSVFSQQLRDFHAAQDEYHEAQGVRVRRAGRAIGAVAGLMSAGPFGALAGAVVGHHVAGVMHQSRVALDALSSEGHPEVRSAARTVAGATGGAAHPRDKTGKFARK